MSEAALNDSELKALENLSNYYKDWINHQESLSNKEKSDTKNLIDIIRILPILSNDMKMGMVVSVMEGFKKGYSNRIKEQK